MVCERTRQRLRLQRGGRGEEVRAGDFSLAHILIVAANFRGLHFSAPANETEGSCAKEGGPNGMDGSGWGERADVSATHHRQIRKFRVFGTTSLPTTLPYLARLRHTYILQVKLASILHGMSHLEWREPSFPPLTSREPRNEPDNNGRVESESERYHCEFPALVLRCLGKATATRDPEGWERLTDRDETGIMRARRSKIDLNEPKASVCASRREFQDGLGRHHAALISGICVSTTTFNTCNSNLNVLLDSLGSSGTVRPQGMRRCIIRYTPRRLRLEHRRFGQARIK